MAVAALSFVADVRAYDGAPVEPDGATHSVRFDGVPGVHVMRIIGNAATFERLAHQFAQAAARCRQLDVEE